MRKEIFKLAIPNIISNITIPLLSLADTTLMGRMSSVAYLGAIALGGLLFNFIYWALGFFRMSTTAFTGQAAGAENNHEIQAVLLRALSLAFMFGIVIIILNPIIANIGFSLLDGSPDVDKLARSYFNIRVYAAPAALCNMVLLAWFIGMKNAIFPMIISICINIFNIALNFFFVFGLDLKSDGVAYGTLASQYLSLAMGIIFYLSKYKDYLKYNKTIKIFDKEKIKHFIKVNRDIFIRTFCIILTIAFFNAESADLGDDILAMNNVFFQFFLFFSFFIDGLAYATEALSSRFHGAGKINKLLILIKIVFLYSAILALLFSLIYLFFGNTIFELIATQDSINILKQDYMIWIIFIPLISFAAFIWDGTFVGLSLSSLMRNSLLISSFLVFLPIYLITFNYWGNHALWLAFSAFLLSRGIVQTIQFKRHLKNNKLN